MKRRPKRPKLSQIDDLCGIKLPLGTSDVVIQTARQLVDRLGSDAFGKSTKLHSRTTSTVLGPEGDSPSDASAPAL